MPWCAKVMKVINTILYWKGVLQQKRGGRVGTSVLCQQAKKGGFKHDLQHIEKSEVDLFTHTKNAYQRYDYLKSDQLCHNMWLAQMIEVQAAAKNLPKKCWLEAD